jgi:low affinity Fe/Cu permease
MPESNRVARALDWLGRSATAWTGSTAGFAAAAAAVLAWAAGGLVVGFSEKWLLVLNTGATVVTFLMVFLLQRSQNRDAVAVQLKLNELIAAGQGASNRLIGIEDVRELSDDDLRALRDRFRMLADLTKEDPTPGRSVSVEHVASGDRPGPGGGEPTG